jgi:hypothetical protein
MTHRLESAPTAITSYFAGTNISFGSLSCSKLLFNWVTSV